MIAYEHGTELLHDGCSGEGEDVQRSRAGSDYGNREQFLDLCEADHIESTEETK